MAEQAATVRHLRAEVRLADPAVELRRARAQAVRGDPAWRTRLQRYEHGDTVIVELTACAVLDDGAGDARFEHACCCCHEAVWVDRISGPRVLAERVRALARRAFATVAPGLRDRGIGLSASQNQITVELEIDPTVSALLRDAPGRDVAGGPGDRR